MIKSTTDAFKEKLPFIIPQIDKIQKFFEEFEKIINNTDLQSIDNDVEKTKTFWQTTVASFVQLRSTVIQLSNAVADLNISLDWMANALGDAMDALFKKLPSRQLLDPFFIKMQMENKMLKHSTGDYMKSLLLDFRGPNPI